MKIHPRCIECLLERVRYESALSTHDAERIRRVVEECRTRIVPYREGVHPAPAVASEIHHLAYTLLSDPDPYRQLKEQSNAEAMAACREVRGNLHSFRDLALAAILANTYDYGIAVHRVTGDFSAFFRSRFPRGLYRDDTPRIERVARRVVYFTDNAGEIVFDLLLVRYLKERGARVTVAVKGAPILNDATLEDALWLGMEREVDLLTTTGSGDIGVTWEKIPGDLARALGDATLVIAKGMANYESLSEYSHLLPPVAYLMTVKCETVAESIGAPVGAAVAVLEGEEAAPVTPGTG
ncbi:MAG: ARMT1-like domain-containing protein [Methanomicrobiales archaeon]|nr:ARMT1-like domain-containing protein [Methanomicrobiales archaeon]